MNIRVFDEIDDPFLKSEWERLEVEADVFPQSTYHWCATWWKHLSGRRKLHVVMLLDAAEKAVAIAPLCIERHFGFRVLRSFPIHFGDFYTFIVSPNWHSVEACGTIIDYILSNRHWRWVRLEQVPEQGALCMQLEQRPFRCKRMTGCVLINYEGLDWTGYLSRLKSKRRWNIRKQLKELRSNYEVTFDLVTESEHFAPLFDEMTAIHEKRWEDDRSPAKRGKQLACRREAIAGQFGEGKMWCCRLILNGEVAAYHLGFLHRQVFYDWHVGFHPKFARNHVGVMILGFMIPEFIERGVERINYMAGDYDWKLAWSPDRRTEANYMFSSPTAGPVSGFLNWYHHCLRDRLKAAYHRMMELKLLRAISRNVISLKQKLSGSR